MRFDPKLIHPDEAPLLPSGDIDLPADLAALGEQLRDDAAHLAARYSAEDGELAAGLAPAVRSRKWIRIAALAGTAAAALVVTVIGIDQFGRIDRTAPVVAVRPPSAVPHRTVPYDAVPADHAAVKVSTPSSAEFPALGGSMTTVSLTDLSGPEFEALLDLWQREPKASEATGISF
jgi:hypothetical protein